ncbi:hypothetical protein [Belnapia sp. F-4-1]|nr:hypothetical protein [Belnapia sp. F-4-1]
MHYRHLRAAVAGLPGRRTALGDRSHVAGGGAVRFAVHQAFILA